MALDDGVRIIDGVIHIDHAAIEAGLRALAARWQVTVEEALGIVLRNAWPSRDSRCRASRW